MDSLADWLVRSPTQIIATSVHIDLKPRSSTFVSCRERELYGLVHDHFITEGDSVHMTWIESRIKERLNFERCADLDVDDGNNKMVTILNRSATWGNQIEIEADPRH